MTIAQNVASKFSVALVATAMIFSMFASAAQAQTTEELQKMINDLLAQVSALQGSTGNASGAGGSCVSIPAPLTLGSTGANVKALQERLIAGGSSIPAGATGYFGEQTRSALASWQTAKSISPAAGYYGAITMAAMDASCTPVDDVDEDEDDSEDDSDSSDLQGEGSLDTFEIDNASDNDVQEGAEDAEIAELTLEATDGDIEVDRMDFKLLNVDSPTGDDPWDVFETISLWVDGEMIAEFDASDEDEYLDEDDGTFRMTDIGLVLMEDEEVEVVIGASVMGSTDDTLPNTWSVEVEEVRYFDADGVADDDSLTGDLGDTATFDIVEEGDGEELTFSLGSNNPDSTDIVVDEDDTTDGVTILEYTIEAEEGDIEINELWVRLESGTANLEDVLDDVMLVIDGEEFDAEATTTGGLSDDYAFDIDGDVVIDADSEVTVEVVVDLKSTDDGANYANAGETIKASVTSALADATDAEGADDLDAGAISGSAVGDTHTLVSEGILVPIDGVETTTDTSGDNDTLGEFTIEFEVTAVEKDFYIRELATGDADGITSATSGVEFMIEGGAGTTTGTLSSTADEDTTGVFTVRDGETETFTLRVTHDAAASGDFRVTLTGVNYSENTNGFYVTAGTDGNLYVPTPAQDFRTDYETIQGS